VRLLYLGAAIALGWVANQQSEALRFEVSQTGSFAGGPWLGNALAAVLAGVMLGLAIRPFSREGGPYRWGIAVTLGVIPLLLIVANGIGFASVGGSGSPPVWLVKIGTFPSPSGYILGLAIVAGSTTRAG